MVEWDIILGGFLVLLITGSLVLGMYWETHQRPMTIIQGSGVMYENAYSNISLSISKFCMVNGEPVNCSEIS
jgi:hypothetical protein